MKASESSSTATWRPGSHASSASSPDRFRLDGPSRRLDPRIHAFRADIADVGLAGLLFAPHYARPRRGSVAAAAIAIRAAPHVQAHAVSQLVHGETFDELDVAGGWAWGRSAHDDYVGYVPADALVPETPAAYRVTAIVAPMFAGPDIKAPVRTTWPIGARLGGELAGDFLATGDGFVHRRHLRSGDDAVADPVAVAEAFVGQPYLWGGRGGGGIDCSGLVQVALGFAGIPAPRDSDQQQAALGRALGPDAALRRGDLVFFPGHVGMMVDEARIVHANACWMAVTIEPLADVVARLGDGGAARMIARRLERGA